MAEVLTVLTAEAAQLDLRRERFPLLSSWPRVIPVPLQCAWISWVNLFCWSGTFHVRCCDSRFIVFVSADTKVFLPFRFSFSCRQLGNNNMWSWKGWKYSFTETSGVKIADTSSLCATSLLLHNNVHSQRVCLTEPTKRHISIIFSPSLLSGLAPGIRCSLLNCRKIKRVPVAIWKQKQSVSLRETNDVIQSGDFIFTGKCFRLLWLFSNLVEISAPLWWPASAVQPASLQLLLRRFSVTTGSWNSTPVKAS